MKVAIFFRWPKTAHKRVDDECGGEQHFGTCAGKH